MKVFVIPSWYPSEDNPIYGIFNQEQLKFLAATRSDWRFGVSTWGQGVLEKQLWAKDHVLNVTKIAKHWKDEAKEASLTPNITEFYTPALSWTKKYRKGNLDQLIKASETNLKSYIQQYGKPDIIWVQSSYPGCVIGNALSKKHSIPYLSTIHFSGYLFENLLGDLGRNRKNFLDTINASGRILCVSEFQKTELRHLIPGAEVLNNPVDTDFFKAINANNGKIIAIGRLEKQKAFDQLLHSMKLVPETKLKIIGRGDERGRLAHLITDLGLDSRVELTGELSREEVRKELQQCSFLALSSIHETFGVCLIEALACGKPVVATKCGGPEEIVTEELGYLAELNSADLASKINLMIKHRSRFKAEEIRRKVEERFSPTRWGQRMEELLRAAVAR